MVLSDKKLRFYVNDSWNKEYIVRIAHYRALLEGKFGDKFNWAIDGEQVKEMVRAELELTHLDRAVVNEATKQDDGFLFVPKHLLNQRDNLRKALNGYRKSLMLDMEVRVRNKVNITTKKSQKERWKETLARANAEDHQP